MAENDQKQADQAEPKEKVEYTESTAARDLRVRLDNDNKVAPLVQNVNPADQDWEGDEGFVGVDPVYQNYANDTEKPLAAEEGVWADAEELHDATLAGELKGDPEVDQQVKDNLDTIQSGGRGLDSDPTAQDENAGSAPKGARKAAQPKAQASDTKTQS